MTWIRALGRIPFCFFSSILSRVDSSSLARLIVYFPFRHVFSLMCVCVELNWKKPLKTMNDVVRIRLLFQLVNIRADATLLIDFVHCWCRNIAQWTWLNSKKRYAFVHIAMVTDNCNIMQLEPQKTFSCLIRVNTNWMKIRQIENVAEIVNDAQESDYVQKY